MSAMHQIHSDTLRYGTIERQIYMCMRPSHHHTKPSTAIAIVTPSSKVSGGSVNLNCGKGPGRLAFQKHSPAQH